MSREQTTIFWLFVILLVSPSYVLIAQNGVYDVRFEIGQSSDCDINEAYFDIEIKAADANSTFRLADQNYRFSFNREVLANPRVVKELDISGNITEGVNAPSIYSPHLLLGSIDTVVSYGFELVGGIGYEVGTDWVTVGRMGFDILDPNGCVDLKWHNRSVFPYTFVSEKFDERYYIMNEGSFFDLQGCIPELCKPLPIELSTFKGMADNCKIQLTWQTVTESNSSHFIIQESTNSLTFSDLDRVEAAGFSQLPLDYLYVDERVGVYNYYRLKAVDLDGSYEYSDVIKVDSDCYSPDVINGVTSVYPNPIKTGHSLKVQVYTNRIQPLAGLVLMDVLGSVSYKKRLGLDEGANTISCIIPQELSPGIYLLQINGDNWFATPQKLVITK